MSEEKPLTIEGLSKLTITVLQAELKKRNLSVKGKKPELIERLTEALSKETPQQESAQTQPDTAKQPAPKKEAPSQTVAPKPVQAQPAAKASAQTAPEKAEEKDDEDVDIGGEEAKPAKQKEGKSGKEVENPKATGGEALSEMEKKRQRAERFGTSLALNEEDKLLQRAQRFGVPPEPTKPKISDPTIARAKRFGLPVKGSEAKVGQQSKGIAASPNRILSAEELEKRKKRAARFATSPVPEKKQKT